MNLIHKYINKGIWFAIIIGTLLHFTYALSNENKFVGYFSATNESIWEHTKLAVFPIIFYSIYMFIKIKGHVNNSLFALGIASLLSIFIILISFYTYIKFTKVPFFPLDISIFLIAVILPFKVIEKIILLPQLPLFMNIVGLIMIICILGSFVRFTYNPPQNKIFIEDSY